MKKMFFGVLVLALSAIVLSACGGGAAATEIPAVPAEYAGATSPLGADAATAGAEV